MAVPLTAAHLAAQRANERKLRAAAERAAEEAAQAAADAVRDQWLTFFEVNGLIPSNGLDGPPGRDGRDGIDGRDGRDGIDGRDGSDGLWVVEATLNYDHGELYGGVPLVQSVTKLMSDGTVITQYVQRDQLGRPYALK